ncbi:response regulator transcription factor [Flavobacterium sp. J49]|uniref:LytR/AlgR family response regulator transcription factor n=1 Tax=Flavobacterium sp. J49 TaxID=2718534 RepID=UPI00159317F1|nr:LytTR family DNA-binding domain-containing protein [Flavobacterium sp. J49]MBF6642196.1 response regulator transcription factor [Flavobacterium sp. J49]NIC03443.1 response regulator transcription factor [Flavobacterium sp. J49]
MKNCIIIDDEMMARTIITELVSTKSYLNIVAEFSNAIDALKYLNKNKVDLIFLDIHMPDFNGFDFINTIKHSVKVILVTSDKNFAIDAFEYDCVVDYLVKPITEERFEKTMLRLKELDGRIQKSQQEIENRVDSDSYREFYINKSNRLIKIDVNTILYFMAKGDYVYLKTETSNYTIHNTLKRIESKLPKDLFFKGHRSYLINTKKIIDIEDNSVLIGKDVIPISRRNRPELMKRVLLL